MRTMLERYRRPFRLSNPPPSRATLVKPRSRERFRGDVAGMPTYRTRKILRFNGFRGWYAGCYA